MSRQMRHEEAVLYYKEAVRIDSMFYPPLFFNLAEAEFQNRKL